MNLTTPTRLLFARLMPRPPHIMMGQALKLLSAGRKSDNFDLIIKPEPNPLFHIIGDT